MMNHMIGSAVAALTPSPAPGVGEQVANELKDHVSDAAETAGNLISHMPQILSRLLMAAAVLVIGLVVLRIGRAVIRSLAKAKGKKDPASARKADTFRSIVSSVFNYIMYFIIVVVALHFFGVDVTSLLAAAGVVGIALAFGAQTLVKDLLAGLFIWGEGSYSVGDLVSINDLDGTVESITIRTTSLRNYNGNVCTIPNGDIRSITNMSREFKRAIVNVPCPYEENQERLVVMIKEEMEIAAKEIEGIDSVPDVMSIVAFDPGSVRLQVSVPCPVGEHWRIERDIRTRIKARFDREGIIMPHWSMPSQN